MHGMTEDATCCSSQQVLLSMPPRVKLVDTTGGDKRALANGVLDLAGFTSGCTVLELVVPLLNDAGVEVVTATVTVSLKDSLPIVSAEDAQGGTLLTLAGCELCPVPAALAQVRLRAALFA